MFDLSFFINRSNIFWSCLILFVYLNRVLGIRKFVNSCTKKIYIFMAQQPAVDQALLIIDASRSQADILTHGRTPLDE
jgi:hypothetical protein